jgi:acyl-CoA hydrolase
MIEFFSEWMFIQTILQLFFLLFTPVLKAATFFIPLKETKQMRNQNQSKTQMAGKEPFKSIMSQLIRSEHCDSRGIAFAGQIMAWMDICAGVSAFRHSGVLVVTAAVDAVHLFNPVLRDNICIIRSSVNRAWKSSLEIGVTVETEDMLTGNITFCCHGTRNLIRPFYIRICE